MESIANLIRFFVCMTPAMMEITKNSLAVNLPDGSALIYQALHLAKSLPFTDKCSEKRLLSVNPQHNGPKFTDKSPENAGLSVKCVLLTDKSAKNGTLSVNLSEILDRLVEQHCI